MSADGDDGTSTDAVWRRDEIDSPCQKICMIHPGARLCVGCFRTIEEIEAWSRLDAAERPAGSALTLGQRIEQWAMRAIVWWLDVDLSAPAYARVFATLQADPAEALWPDGEVTVAERRVPVSEVAWLHEMTGDHDPVGVFLAAGRGILDSDERIALSVLDVAPLLFYLAGRPLPDDLDGETRSNFEGIRARVFALLRDFEAAERHLAAADEADPDSAWIRVERSFLLKEQDRYADALAVARHGLELRPWFSPAVSLVAYLLHPGKDLLNHLLIGRTIQAPRQ